MTDDVPTPKVSESWNFFARAADDMALRLEKAAVVYRAPMRLETFSLRASERCRELAEHLRRMARRFAAWPTAPSDVVATERMTLPSNLLDAVREGEELDAGSRTHVQ